MEQMYTCPNCGEIVYYGEPACPNCGMQLDWTTVETSPPQDEYQYQDYGQDQQQWDQQQWDQQQWTPPPDNYQQAEYGQYHQPPPPGKRGRSGKMSKPPAQKRPYGESSIAIQKRKKIIKISLISVVCAIIAAAAISLGVGFNPFASDDSGTPGTTTTPSSENTTPVVPISGPIEIVKFIVDPTVIPDGETSTLYWEVTGAEQVTIDQGIGTVSPVAQQSISPSATTTYTLTASNSSGSETATATISVNIGAPKVTFTANPTTVSSGGSTTLTWKVTGATTIKLGHDSVAATGTREVTDITSSTTFTLTATNSAGVTEATAKVTIGASGKPVITTFGADNDFLESGESATLEWYVTNADSVSINQGIGTVGTYGSETVSPDSTTTYTLTATNSAGTSTMQVTVTISSDGKPVINDFYASPINITTGQTSTLHWNVAGADTIFIDPGIGAVDASGTETVLINTTTTYQLSATNENGTTTATATVNYSTVDLPEIEAFSVNPSTIPAGSFATLSWEVSNADTISIDNGVGTVQPTGSTSVNPVATTTYTITATKGSQSVTDTVQMSVY
jgi:uncharacterized cupredoxin-like copper-binding protein